MTSQREQENRIMVILIVYYFQFTKGTRYFYNHKVAFPGLDMLKLCSLDNSVCCEFDSPLGFPRRRGSLLSLGQAVQLQIVLEGHGKPLLSCLYLKNPEKEYHVVIDLTACNYYYMLQLQCMLI